MKRFVFATHLRNYILRGLLAIIPIVLSWLAVQLLYVAIDKRLQAVLKEFFGFSVPGLGILLVLVVLYTIGVIASNVIGKQFFNFIESLSARIPLIRTIYQIGKQLSTSLALPEKQFFQKVILLELRPGVQTVGFVTGFVIDKNDRKKRLKVFIPKVPNPATGYIMIVEESQVIDPNWTVEEGLKMIISGGIIGPESMEKKRL